MVTEGVGVVGPTDWLGPGQGAVDGCVRSPRQPAHGSVWFGEGVVH